MLQEAHAKGLVENKFEYGGDSRLAGETYISSQFERPVMVHRYPAVVKAFPWNGSPAARTWRSAWTCWHLRATARLSAAHSVPASYELLLIERIHEHGLPEEAFKWYLDLRKYGSVPHQASGMGIERAVAWVTMADWSTCARTIPFAANPAPAIPVSLKVRAF